MATYNLISNIQANTLVAQHPDSFKLPVAFPFVINNPLITVTKQVTGAAGSTSSITGGMNQAQGIRGSSVSTSNVAGIIKGTYKLVSSITATSTSSGVITGMCSIIGLVHTTTSALGLITGKYRSVGSISSTSGASGTMSLDKPLLAGNIASTSTVIAGITGKIAIGGQVVYSSDVPNVNIKSSTAVTGLASAVSAASSQVKKAAAITGQMTTASNVSTSLINTIRSTGQIAGTSIVQASIKKTANVQSLISSLSGASAYVSILVPISGGIETTTDSANIPGQLYFPFTLPFTFEQSVNKTTTLLISIASTSTVTANVTGALVNSGQISATSNIEAAATGSYSASSTCNTTSEASVYARTQIDSSGAVSAISNCLADVKMVAQLFGNASDTSSLTGGIRASRKLEGSAASISGVPGADIQIKTNVAGSVVTLSEVTNKITKDISISGEGSAVSIINVSIVREISLASQITAISASVASLSGLISLSGQSLASSDLQATLSKIKIPTVILDGLLVAELHAAGINDACVVTNAESTDRTILHGSNINAVILDGILDPTRLLAGTAEGRVMFTVLNEYQKSVEAQFTRNVIINTQTFKTIQIQESNLNQGCFFDAQFLENCKIKGVI